MTILYLTSDRRSAENLQRQMTESSPDTDLRISDRTDDARHLLATGDIDAVLIDTGLPEDDVVGLVTDIRRDRLPLVVIVADASAVRSSAFWALQADYVWAYDADTGYARSLQRLARDVLVAIRQAVERSRAEHDPPRGPVRTAYIGGDDVVRGFLGAARDVHMTTADDPGCDVVVIDASPFDAIEPLRELRTVAPLVPVVLLCDAEIRDPEDVANVLRIDRVLAKSESWPPRLLTLVHAVAEQGPRSWQEPERPRMPSAAPRPDAPIAPGDAGARQQHLAVRKGDPATSAPWSPDVEGWGTDAGVGLQWAAHPEAMTSEPPQDLATCQAQCITLQRRLDEVRASARLASILEADRLDSILEAERLEWSTRLEALSASQQQELATSRADRDQVQQLLDETKARAARLASALDDERAGSRSQLDTLAAQQQQDLTQERAQRHEMVLKLRAAQDEIRRKTRLSVLTDGVVTQLASFIRQMEAQVSRAAEDAPAASPLGGHLDRARRTAGRAQDLARRFQAFCRGPAEPPELTDLNRIILDLEAMLQRLIGSQSDLLLRIESTVALVALSQGQIRRLLFGLLAACGDALPIGGQVTLETRNVEIVPSWDTRVPCAEPVPFVRLTVMASGHAPQPMRVTPALESLIQECDGHCEEVSTDDPSSGFCLSLPRSTGAPQS
ncbi:MAG: hypothetical protein ABL971_10385 [Vicinamibacterales bacterium]